MKEKDVSSEREIRINQQGKINNKINNQITFVKMQIHNVDNDSVDRLYVVLCADPVTFCAWTIVRSIHTWMAYARHVTENN